MDRGTLGAISTVLVTLAFIGVCWWAFSPRRKKRFDEAANLPFADEDTQDTEQPQAEDLPAGGEQRREHRSDDAADRRN